MPVYSVRVCSGVCYEEFGSVYENIILEGLVAHTFYPLIYAGCVYIASEDPENLEFGIVLKWKGKNSALNPVVLMSHYDVVGDEGQDWKHPAFEAEIHDGVIWARGSIDTKGLLAATLEAMEKLTASGVQNVSDANLYAVCGF